MAEGWTREETRRRHRWCEGRGMGSGGIPICRGKAVLLSKTFGEQRCQRCLKRMGPPPSSKEHVVNDEGACVSWCPACQENAGRGLTPAGHNPGHNLPGADS